MTRRLYEDIHARLAAARFFELRDQGEQGRVAIRAFAETTEAARAQYRAIPWWRRWRN